MLRLPPRPLAEWLGRQCARVLDSAVPRLRRFGRRNLEMALPDRSLSEREAILDGVFASIGRVLVAFARFPDITRQRIGDWIRYEGYEHFEEAKRRGKGVLFATAHLGNWELSAFAHAYLSSPMHVVVRPLDNPLVDALVEERRALSGNTITGKRDAARTILRALQQNEAVGILIDQNSMPEQGVFVDFFGIPACTHATFAKLAIRTGATVIPGYAIWSPAELKYILKFDPPLDMSDDVVECTQRLQSHFEQVIRRYPDQWLWVHRRWKTRPPGAPPLY